MITYKLFKKEEVDLTYLRLESQASWLLSEVAVQYISLEHNAQTEDFHTGRLKKIPPNSLR